MKEILPETPLVIEGDWDREWTVSHPSLPELKQLLGLPLLVEFCRCSVAADRLLSLGDLGASSDRQRGQFPVAHERNLQTMFWFTWGTIHEAIDAIEEMEMLGIEGLFASFPARKPWLELRSVLTRWTDNPVYQRVRNRIAFHIDAAALRKGINRPGRETEPVIWKKGNTKQERSSFFPFAETCLVAELFPEGAEAEWEKRFTPLAESVRNVHLGFTSWVQEVFIEAVRGASMGLKLQPKDRPKIEALSEERLREAEGVIDDAGAGIARDVIVELLREVRRLQGIAGRGKPDSQATQAQRRTDEERRLRAIAAVAKEFVSTHDPAAERRLAELLAEPVVS